MLPEEAAETMNVPLYNDYNELLDKDEWRNKRATGGGPLTSNGIHDIDRIRYICGDFDTVTALMSNKYRGFEVEDTMAISIKCKNGAVGTFYISDCSYSMSDYTDYYFFGKASVCFNCSSFYPTEGFHTFSEVTMDDAHPAYYKRERTYKTIVMPEHNNHVTEMQHFTRVIRGLEEPRCTGKDAKKSLQAMLAIIESAEKQKTIKL